MPTLFDLMYKHEGAGSPSTLFGHAQKPGGAFEGVDVSKMTLGELKEFSDPSGPYGQWVKQKHGVVSTPMGVGQIVGSTMRNVQGKLGLSDDTVFDADTQRMMVDYLARNRIKPDNREATLTGLRDEWAGFKNVDDDTLWEAAMSYNEGNTGKFTKFQGAVEEDINSSKGAIGALFGGGGADNTPGGEGGLNTDPSLTGYRFPAEMGRMHVPSENVYGFDTPQTLNTRAMMFGNPQLGYDMPAPVQRPNPVVGGGASIAMRDPAALAGAAGAGVEGGAAGAGVEGGAAEDEVQATLLDKISSTIFPNAADPADKFKQALGALGVGLGQMSAGSPVDLQPYFANISARRAAAAEAVQKAEQQAVENRIRVGTLQNQQRQSDISAARLAHDIAKEGRVPTAEDYAAIVATYPELGDTAQLAMAGDKNAQKAVIDHIAGQAALQLTNPAGQTQALKDYVNAGNDTQKRIAAVENLTPEQRSEVVKLAGDITGDKEAPAAWQNAERLATDMPDVYKTPGEAFMAIEKMRVTGGELPAEQVKANINGGMDQLRTFADTANTAFKKEAAAIQAESSVEGLMAAGSAPNEGLLTVGELLQTIPFVGFEAQQAFFQRLGIAENEARKLNTAQADLLALIAQDYQGQGEISDAEREAMAERVINGKMSPLAMYQNIYKLRADASFARGDLSLYTSLANSSDAYAGYAKGVEAVVNMSSDKQAVLKAQSELADYMYYSNPNSPDSKTKQAYMGAVANDPELLASRVLPRVSSEFAKHYKNSLPLWEDDNGKVGPAYINMDGEIVVIGD